MKILFEIDKKFILDKVSEDEIFIKYLNIPFIPEEKFCSPLRKDSTPTCSIKRLRNGVLWFRDWSGHFSGDCFSLVMFLHGCNFYEACEIIAKDFKLIENGQQGLNFDRVPLVYNKTKPVETTIKVQWKPFGPDDLEYWGNHGISLETLKTYKTGVVKFAWVNGKCVYSLKKLDTCYGYWFETGKIKLYFPNRNSNRFLGNTTLIQGYNQLPEKGKTLIITKSLKDVMFLHECDIPAIAPQSESIIVSQDLYNELKTRFDKIYSLYDFDRAGVTSTNKMKKMGIIPKFFTNGRFGTIDYEAKDPTDLVKSHGEEHAYNTIIQLLDKDNWY